MTDPCRICGHNELRDLGTALAHWREAPKGMAYEHVTRCRDVEACRQRIADQGDIWPLEERPGDHRRAS
jgi:hypothetical protein